MTNNAGRLPALSIPGLAPDSPGNYLASLGLLRLLARRWPSVRIAWRDGVLHVVGGPTSIDEVVDEIVAIGASRKWTPYNRDWLKAQKQSTEAKSGVEFALWQAAVEETVLELAAAHVVPAAKLEFNPLLGKGGSAGNRDISDGWTRAANLLESSANKGEPPEAMKRSALGDLLLGHPVAWTVDKAPLEPKGSKKKHGLLNAACWFSEANTVCNSGQSPSRTGRISPWLMALACEGLVFLAGGASRRLGMRADRGRGAFPFVTQAAAPLMNGEAGRDSGELWAPLWERPMTLPEVRALFSRGRAEIRGRGAVTPSAFAAAIVRRGVDAGITEFRRFALGRTTSAQTFEPRLEGVVRLPTPVSASSTSLRPAVSVASNALDRVLGLVERLPRDERKGQRWRFVGLRGPIEQAMIELAAAPEDPGTACVLLDAMVAALDRVDRNQSFRKRRLQWRPLPTEWLPALFGTDAPGFEVRLAIALTGGFPRSRPLALYRFGVEKRRGRFEHPERPPARWVWGPGPLSRVLSSVVQRRLLDWEAAVRSGRKESPMRYLIPAGLDAVSAWLEGSLDESLLRQWISRLALFDWSAVPHDLISELSPRDLERAPVSGALALLGVLQPLLDLRPLRARHQSRDMLDRESGARTPAAARSLASLVRAGRVDAAVRYASGRYAMACAPLVRAFAPWQVSDPERLLASVLFPFSDNERTMLVEWWLRPRRRQGDEAHV